MPCYFVNIASHVSYKIDYKSLENPFHIIFIQILKRSNPACMYIVSQRRTPLVGCISDVVRSEFDSNFDTRRRETEEVTLQYNLHTPNRGFTVCRFGVFELKDEKMVRYLCCRWTRPISSERLTHETAWLQVKSSATWNLKISMEDSSSPDGSSGHRWFLSTWPLVFAPQAGQWSQWECVLKHWTMPSACVT